MQLLSFTTKRKHSKVNKQAWRVAYVMSFTIQTDHPIEYFTQTKTSSL